MRGCKVSVCKYPLESDNGKRIGMKGIMIQWQPRSEAASAPVPAEKGSYALVLRLEEEAMVSVGKLGMFLFPRGIFVYCGNAFGPGGLRARVHRHLRGGFRQPHWHIDYLISTAQVWRVHYTVTLTPLECRWSQALAGQKGAFIPAPRFGVMDCRSGCPAHLVGFPHDLGSVVERIMSELSEGTTMQAESAF